jgi:hypothetical protein
VVKTEAQIVHNGAFENPPERVNGPRPLKTTIHSIEYSHRTGKWRRKYLNIEQYFEGVGEMI